MKKLIRASMWFTIISNLIIVLIFISPIYEKDMIALYVIVGFTTFPSFFRPLFSQSQMAFLIKNQTLTSGAE